ncbi:electron transfer flavoprotein subunit alpha/FixB family protein [Candidatus Izemoplasma sp. B36]|uniref:electron transfer flavoprotein subunit alpha/FixB family protein n=1 Tax=Candidatus Izemoplasma sp. B36 TaxID=3242468 RepID=UPI003556F21D
MENYKDVLVYIEQRHGEIQTVSLELLGIGKTLAEKLNVNVNACIVGNNIKNLAKELAYYGANKVYIVENEILENYVNEPYTKALATVINDVKPEIVLVGATSIGRDLAPRVSSRVHTGLTADCTNLDIDPETNNLLMTRPAFGGNLMATIICPNHRPQMSTVRPGVMVQSRRDETLTSEMIDYHINFTDKDMNVQVLERVKEKAKKIRIEDANVLVSAGRGIGSKENMKSLYQLSDMIKGEVSGTRAVVDNGWLDKERQVGQTGKTVRPDLYIAAGISGAIQHVSGMEDSNLIIAINKNPSAPIFEVADVGIVGDATKIIPEVIKELKQISK